jgi:hypothetical protein
MKTTKSREADRDTAVYECWLDNGCLMQCRAQDLDEAASMIGRIVSGSAVRPLLDTLTEAR